MNKLISIREACSVTSLSRTTLWKKVKDGAFPKPIDLSCNRKAFLASEVDDWISDRVADRDSPSKRNKIA